jgi:hypothetical protein
VPEAKRNQPGEVVQFDSHRPVYGAEKVRSWIGTRFLVFGSTMRFLAEGERSLMELA